ncbi:MAG: FkbM family methyltransferase [Bacteroidia bacterium]
MNLPLTKIKIFFGKILYRGTRVFYGSKPRIIERKGIKYEVDLSEGIDLSLFLFGNFQKHITHNPLAKLKEDAVILDVGANFGIMTLQFAQATPKGTIYSFEPTHYALGKFKRNLELNPELAKHIYPVNSFVSAVTDKNSTIKAFSSWKVDGATGSDMHPVHLGEAKSTEGVGAISIDDFCTQNNFTRLDFIKIDVDGHEFEVFKGGMETIKKFRPVIIFEIGLYLLEENKIDYTFFSDYFSKLNYKLVDAIKGIELTPENYRQYIPGKGTIDIIALPR